MDRASAAKLMPMYFNQIDEQTANALEILASAITEYMGWEEVGQGACCLSEGFIIHLN